MAGFPWLTDELWRGHWMADTQLPSYPYLLSSYTNSYNSFFHRDAQHQLCEVGYTGHILYNTFMNIVLLPAERITMGNKEQTRLEYSYSFWNSASKSWLFISCMKTSPKAPFAIQHEHQCFIFPISKDHKCFLLIQMWIEYFGVPWHAVLTHK